MDQIQIISNKEDIELMFSKLFSQLLAGHQYKYVEPNLTANLINSKELSQKLGISAPTLFRWRKKGKIPYLRVGESIKYNLADVIKAIEVRRGL